MKYFLAILSFLIFTVFPLEAVEYNFSPREQDPIPLTEMDVANDEVILVKPQGKFYITKVNRIEKLWVIPPERRNFMGSRGITKYDYARLLPEKDRGEDYVITWQYRGEELDGNVMLKFEYRTINNAKEQLREVPYIEEYQWSDVKRGTYRWTFKNTGGRFAEKGKIDRWKVSIVYEAHVVAAKRSATWRTMEGS